MTISPSGIITVDTRRPMRNTSFEVVMFDGYQSHTSPIFWIEVVEVITRCFSYLEQNITNKEYELEIGKENFVDLDKYIANGTDAYLVKAFYFMGEIEYGKYKKEKIEQQLDDVFIIHTNYDKDNANVELNIDLTYVDPKYEDSTVVGNLTLMTNFLAGPIYHDVKFTLKVG